MKNPAWLVTLAAMLLLGIVSLHGQFQNLVPLHQEWRYAYDGVDQGTNWRAREFDDSEWATGATLFGYDTSPVYFEPFRTALPNPATVGHPITAYFRTSFDFDESPPTNSIFYLTNWIDDGAVFYLNGREVGRLRINNVPVQYSTLASNLAVEGQSDIVSFSSTNCPLFPQGNVLAIEVHQNATNSADIVFGSILAQEILRPLFITQQPQDLVVSSNMPARLEVEVAGSYPKYQWYRDGFRLLNQTNAAFTLMNAWPRDQGPYYVVVSNAYGSSVTSRVATLTVIPDQIGPELLSAIVPTAALYTNKVNIRIYDPANIRVATASATNNYVVELLETGEKIGVITAQFSSQIVRLSLDRNWDPTKTYIITVNGLQDGPGNYIKPNSQVVVQFTKREVLLGLDDTIWWFTGPPKEPTGWRDLDYVEDPMLWARGPALVMCDTTAWEPCTGSRVTATHCSTLAHYFRTEFVNSNAPAVSSLLLQMTIDDGAVTYLNGLEIGRMNMPPGTINHSTRASANVADSEAQPPPCQPLTVGVTNLIKGTNLLAVEVHQSMDSDITFGLAMEVEYVLPPPLVIPALRITRTDGQAQIWWPGFPWKLERTTNLSTKNWERVDTQDVPFTTPATNGHFFRVHQP